MTNPRERNNKEDNRQNQSNKINRNFREETHQKKLPSHRNIKKSTRKRNNCDTTVCIFSNSYDC